MRVSKLMNTGFKINMQAEKLKKQNLSNHNTKDVLVGASIALAGITAIVVGKKYKLSYEDALKKNNVELKDGIALLKNSAEKFTGEIKRNVKAFGIKTETTRFVDGIISERIYHNALKEELEGLFYKNGILRIKMGSGKNYSLYEYDSNGKLFRMGDCRNNGKEKFEIARNMIKELKD